MGSEGNINGKLKYTYVIDMLQMEFSSRNGFESNHLHSLPNKTSVYFCLEGARDMGHSGLPEKTPSCFPAASRFF